MPFVDLREPLGTRRQAASWALEHRDRALPPARRKRHTGIVLAVRIFTIGLAVEIVVEAVAANLGPSRFPADTDRAVTRFAFDRRVFDAALVDQLFGRAVREKRK